MTLRNVRGRVGAVVWLFSILSMAGSTAWAELKPLRSVEGITEYRLDNGLQVLLFPDPSKPTVTVNITYFVGSRHEGRGETGMAHLLEHMVFKGTPTHPSVWKALEDHGARFNGTTWVDRTNYFETLPTTEEGNLEWALKMEADRMVNSFIRKEDLDSEMTVVRNEFEMGENSPEGILEERMIDAAYQWHNYGKTTIGSKSDIERVPIRSLQAFYKNYYQPDNAMLVVAGDFKAEKALSLIEKYFGAIPRPQRKLEDTYTLEPEQDGARLVQLRRNGDVAAVGTVYHICSASHADYPAIEVIQNILTDEPSGRLYKALVESGMAASVSGTPYGWKEPGAIVNMASVRMENPVDPVLAKMIEVIEGLAKSPITEEEVKRAKTKLLKNIELALKDSGRIGVQMSEWAASGDWRLFFMHRDRLENIKLDEVRKAAALYFKESNRTAGVFYPTKEPTRTVVPESPDVVALLKDYKGKAALSEGEEWEATPDNIEKRLTRTTFPNGLKLAMLPKETRGDVVQAVMTFRFGTEADVTGRQTAVAMIPEMLMRGSKNHTFQQLKDKIDELKANVSITAGAGGGPVDGSIRVSIRTDREHLPAVLDLVAEVLRYPTLPAEEFEIVKKENLAGLEEQLSDPQALAFTNVMRRMSPWPSSDVRYVPTVAEAIERLKAVELDYLRQFHKELYGAGNAEVTVVGDFDPAAVKGVVEKTLASWKSPKKYARIESPFRNDITASDDVIQTPDKKMATVLCAVNMEVRDDDPDYPALHLANYIIGASAKSRLLERLRQKEGLSYGAGSFFQADSEDRDAVFGASAICAPENVEKANASMADELSKIVNEGVPAEELADAKKSYALQVQNRLANDGAVAGMINGGLYLGRKMDYYKNLYKQVDEVTPEQLKKALKQHMALGRMVKVKAGDLKDAKAGG